MLVRVLASGVIVFLAAQAFTLYSLFERIFARRRSAGEYATFPIPGEAQVTLPVGKVKLRYQESYRAWSGGEPGVGIDFGVPAKLQMAVTSPDGESLDIKGPASGGWAPPWRWAAIGAGRSWAP